MRPEGTLGFYSQTPDIRTQFIRQPPKITLEYTTVLSKAAIILVAICFFQAVSLMHSSHTLVAPSLYVKLLTDKSRGHKARQHFHEQQKEIAGPPEIFKRL